ncbi:phage distal tail protein [Peptoniphilus sp.]|jgi:hypothetical protein|uniref:phage distal tail protein n=1 Tax=Peptoniphilus sp. TaxID=1971214 RepID=UPI003D8A4F49
MTKYNVGKFNVKNADTLSVSANSDIAMDAGVISTLLEIYTPSSQSSLNLDCIAEYHVELTGISTDAEMFMDTYGLPANLVYASEAVSDLVIDAGGVGSLLGEDYVEITGLRLRPGQEVEIDMCNLTVTVNGENAIDLMSEDGDFFDFLIGDNDILIEAMGANSVKIDTYWKDKWL